MSKYKLTPEHRAQLKNYTQKWIDNGLSTKPMDDYDREQMIVGHSETGHHHVLERPDHVEKPLTQTAKMLIKGTNNLIAELRFSEETLLVHQRGHDTHKGYMFFAATYVRKIREEQNIEGWQRSID